MLTYAVKKKSSKVKWKVLGRLKSKGEKMELNGELFWRSLVVAFRPGDAAIKPVQGEGRVKMKVKVLVAQWHPTLCNPTGCSPPGSSVRGTFQAKILEWVAIPFSRGSRGAWTQVSCIAGRLFTAEPEGKGSKLEILKMEVWQFISCFFPCETHRPKIWSLRVPFPRPGVLCIHLTFHPGRGARLMFGKWEEDASHFISSSGSHSCGLCGLSYQQCPPCHWRQPAEVHLGDPQPLSVASWLGKTAALWSLTANLKATAVPSAPSIRLPVWFFI